jgi:ribosomal protein S18 acetylase RimI-like enzyme
MEFIRDVEYLNNQIQHYFKKGTFTNNYFLLDTYIKYIVQQKLAFVSSSKNAAFLVENPEFYKMYYYLNDFDDMICLPSDKPIVMEILYRDEQFKPVEIFNYWKTNGFKMHLTRDNLLATFNKLIIPEYYSDDIVINYANSEKELIYTQQLLESALDKYTGDLLSFDEIRHYINQQNVICAYYDHELAGVLQFEVKNKIVWLGHIAVDLKFRGKGLANEMVRKYIVDNHQDENTKYQLWVIQDNIGAVNLYRKFGFVYGNKSTASMIRMNN